MRIIYLLIGLLSLLPLLVSGQTINLQQYNSGESYCAGSVLSVSFTTSGTFATGNTFRVQLSSNYGSSFTDLPGSFASSPASVTLPASSVPGSNYVVRVLADKPLVASSYSYSFRVAAKPTAQITGSSARSVPQNPYTSVNLTMALTGGSPYTLVLQDSARVVTYNEYSNSDFLVYPARTTTYSLARVLNACGTGVVSGSATVPINAVGFQLLGRGNESICLGAELPVYFSTTAPLPANTTFEAELISTYDGNRSISVPVSGTASPLLVTLPKQYIGSYNNGYQLRIFSRSANVSAYYGEGSTFNLNTSPRLSLSATSASVPFGGQTSLLLSYTTSSSGDVFLSDGRQITVYGSGIYGSSISSMVSPDATTSYSIVSYSGACSEGVSYGSRSATVRVRSGMRIDSLSTNEVCSGQPVTMFYGVTPGYTVPERLKVRYGYGYVTDATVAKNGQITFTPVISLAFQNQAIQLMDASVDTMLTQTTLPLTIKTKPFISFTRDQQTVSNAGDVSLEASYYGGGTTQVLLNTGIRIRLTGGYLQSYSYQTYLPVYVSGTTAFSVVSIANECGVGPLSTARPVTTVTVTNVSVLPTGILIRSTENETNICPGSRQSLNVYASGTFNADNQFQLEIASANGSFSGAPVQSFTKAEGITFTAPTVSGSYRVWVTSTSPVTRSNELSYYINTLPTATVYIALPNSSGSTGSLTTVAGQLINANYTISGGRTPYQYELVTGAKGQADYSFQATYQPTTTTSFGFARVTDACGVTATITGSPVTVTVVPALLRTGSVNSSQACVQYPMLVPYTQFGTVPASASYVVQFSDDLATWQTAPTSGSASPLTVMLPGSLANRQVYYRVAYIVNGLLTAGIRYESRLLIKSAPDVVLTTPSSATAIQIDRNNSSSSEIKLFDLSSDATVILTSGTAVIKANVYASGSSYYISQPGTYSIASAYNSCGYGRATGIVKVTEKPYLTLLKAGRTSACVGQTVSFTYTAAGDFEPGNKLSVYLIDNYSSSQPKTLLAETTALSGVVTFTLNAGLRPSSYSVQMQASAPATTLSGFTMSVDAPVSVSLISASKVVYSGDTQDLTISSTATGPYTATLATPTGLTVINSSYAYYYLPVRFTQSGSFSLVNASNQCGVGSVSGVISVTTLPISDITIRPGLSNSLYCTGKQYLVYINTTGVFSTTNTFTAYLSDSTGGNVRALPTVSGPFQLTVTMPADLPAGDRYQLRVGSSSPQHTGASTTQNLYVRQAPTGTLTGSTSLFKGDSTRIRVALTGTPPWQFVLTDFFGPRTFTTATSPYTLTVKPDTTVGFRLAEVRDSQCGLGTATGTALITVTKLLATEPALPLQVRTWPNPTTGWLQLEGDVPGRGDVLVGLYTASGTLVQQLVGVVRQGQLQHRMDLSGYPAGVYILTAEQEGRRSQFKVLKQ